MQHLCIEEKSEISKSFGGIASYYGLRARPSGFGGTPTDHSAIYSKEEALGFFPALKDNANVRHGVICYPVILDDTVVKNFELIRLNKQHGIEEEHLNFMQTSPFQQSLILLLAVILNQDGSPYIFEELKYDGDFILREAFKKTKIYSLRKSMDTQYKTYFSCLKTISPEAVIEQLIILKKEEITHV